MRILWAILCQSSVVDKQTNNISLFNVIEEIQIVGPSGGSVQKDARLDLIAPRVFDLVIMFARSDFESPEKGKGRVRMKGPEPFSKEGLPQEFEVDLIEHPRYRMIVKIPGIPITGKGTHQFLVDCSSVGQDWESLFELPILVTVHLPDTISPSL